MIFATDDTTTRVARLRIRGKIASAPAAQLRVAAVLGNTDIFPFGVARSAIVFIRKLSDPLPGVLRLQRNEMQPPHIWQEALTSALDQLVRNAARPALEAVPANANAVIFLDRAELLACLASDWCEGRVITRWWWQSLLIQADVLQVVKRVWLDAPEYIPAALKYLAVKGKAIEWVRCLSAAEVQVFLQCVARRFALHALLPVLDCVADRLSHTQQQSLDRNRKNPAVRVDKNNGLRIKAASNAPWLSWVPETDSYGLGTVQQLFLGLVLMLQRAPARVRSASLASEVQRWWVEVAALDEWARELNAPDTLQPEREPREINRKESVFHASQTGEETTSLPKTFGKAPVSTAAMYMGLERVDSVELDKIGLKETSADQIEHSRPSFKERHFVNAEHSSNQVEHRDLAAVATDELPPLDVIEDQVTSFVPIEDRIDTQFGGLFYLTNLALYLGLYGDFTTPAEPGIELNIWDFVLLAGHELAGEDLQRDPLWSLLRRLATREEGEQPGSGFEPDDEWRLPAEWLRPFSTGSFKLSTSDRRLRLVHSEGFLVLDVPLETRNPGEQLERELKAYESFEFRVSSCELSQDSALEEKPKVQNSKLETSFEIRAWLDRLMPYVRARLRKALGLGDTDDPAPVLCRHHARVYVTANHLDVFFTLVTLPIEIRLAGLDRNPGWVPAAGKFIGFYFD